jgi:hypothetical protein
MIQGVADAVGRQAMRIIVTVAILAGAIGMLAGAASVWLLT